MSAQAAQYAAGVENLVAAAAVGDLKQVVFWVTDAGIGIDAVSDDGYGTTPLLAAAFEGQLLAVKWLVSRGAIIDKAQIGGTRPLLAAIDHGHTATAVWLIEQGADPHIGGNGGMTPLVLAAYTGMLEVVRSLVEKGQILRRQKLMATVLFF